MTLRPRPGPLSVFTYYARNKRKVVPLLLILTLAVALMVVVQSLVSSASDTAYAIFGSYSQIEVVAPRVQSSQDAYKPIAATIAALRENRAKLAGGGAIDAQGGLGNLSSVIHQLQDVQTLAGELEALQRQYPAGLPSTAALQQSLGTASQHGQSLQADLARLSAELQRLQQHQSQQAQLAQLLDNAQKNPADTAALLAYLKAPHDFTGLIQPDTTDYGVIANDASSASADAGALGADLGAVQAQVSTLSKVLPATAPTAPRLPSLPKLNATLQQLPAAEGALKGLGDQLLEMEQKLEALGAPQGNIDAIEAQARQLPGVDRVERDTYSNIDLNMLAGDANFDLYGLSDDGMRHLMAFYGDRVATGRLPRQDAAEVALSEEVARARGVGIGDMVGSDVHELDSLPEHFKIVGLLSGPVRLGFIPRDYMTNNYFGARRYQALVVVPKLGHVVEVRAPLQALVKDQPYRIFDGPFVDDKIDSLLVNLRRINDFLTLVGGAHPGAGDRAAQQPLLPPAHERVRAAGGAGLPAPAAGAQGGAGERIGGVGGMGAWRTDRQRGPGVVQRRLHGAAWTGAAGLRPRHPAARDAAGAGDGAAVLAGHAALAAGAPRPDRHHRTARLMTALLEAAGLTLTFGAGERAFTAVLDVDVALQDHSYLGVVGPSGSGKSSLLYLLSGLKAPTAGRVTFRDVAFDSIGEAGVAALRRREFGFIFQQHFLVNYLGCVENVLVGARRGPMQRRGGGRRTCCAA